MNEPNAVSERTRIAQRELTPMRTEEQLKALEALFTQLFSLDNLSRDPLLVYSMSPDLWLPISLLAALESVQRISRDRKLLHVAALNCGLEYSAETDSVRPKLSFERTKMVVWHDFTPESLADVAEKYAPLHGKPDGRGVWEFTFSSEAENVAAVLGLQNAGYRASVSPVNSYFVVLSSVKQHEPTLSSSALACLFEAEVPKSSLYSPQQMLQIASQMPSIEKPGALKLASLCSSVVSQYPRVSAN